MTARPKLSDVAISKIQIFISRERGEEGFSDLVNSIKNHGLIIPITIQKKGKRKYRLLKGQGRLLAHKKLDLKQIKSFVYEENEITDQNAIEHWLIENKVRLKLAASEKARLIALEIKTGESLENVAKRYGVSTNTGKQYVDTYNKTSQKVLDMTDDKKLTFSHVRAISSQVEDDKEQEAAAEVVKSEGFSTSDAFIVANLIKDLKKSKTMQNKKVSVSDIRSGLRAMNSDLKKFKSRERVLRNRANILAINAKIILDDIKILDAIKDANIDIVNVK